MLDVADALRMVGRWLTGMLVVLGLHCVLFAEFVERLRLNIVFVAFCRCPFGVLLRLLFLLWLLMGWFRSWGGVLLW